MGGGILIASEGDLDSLFGPTLPELNLTPGCNIKTGCYGLFLVALDNLENPEDKPTFEEAIDALEAVCDCLVGNAISAYYKNLEIDYMGILRLADAIIFLNDTFPGKHATDFTEDEIVKTDDEITGILCVNKTEALTDLFKQLGFEPLPLENYNDRQLELPFGE